MFWSGEELARRIPAEGLIAPFDEKSISCAAYELRLGGEAFVSRDGKGHETLQEHGLRSGLSLLDKESKDPVSIPAGQFAYLLTEEVVSIPPDALGFISVKAGKKLEGLVNVSGFHVDPGWSSRLIFGVYNAGPRTIVLRRGDRLFLLFYASLNQKSDQLYEGGPNKYTEIPATMMQAMSGPIPSLYKVNEGLKELKSDVASAKWQARIGSGLATIALGLAGSMVAKGLGSQGQAQNQPPVLSAPAAIASPAAASPATTQPPPAPPAPPPKPTSKHP